ncbi:MAG: thiamine-monophosphate kinase [Verrucomicrobiota bacterium]|jgi:thiamine-monophosphate kinase
MKLRQVGEDRLLERLLPTLTIHQGVIAAAGDDVAVVEPARGRDLLLLKTDCVVEDVHFDSTAAPDSIGWKAMMRPLSDFAAVSGVPQFALTTLIVSKETRTGWVEKVYRGLNRAAARFHVSVVGGETSSTRGPVVISVSVAGSVERRRWVSRSGGRPGDRLFVTGRLGGSRKGKHLRFVPRIEESRWLTSRFPIHAMIDLSDGLGADLPRLARASHAGFEVEKSHLPCSRGASLNDVISDGEDYELLFAISPRQSTGLQRAWERKFPKVPLTDIGRLVPQSPIRNRQLKGGYVHFQ